MAASHDTPLASQRLKLKATLALAAAPFATALPAFAETAAEFPTRPVRWICPTSTGAGTDAAARAFAQIASEAWKQGCVVDNRSGASGMIGLEMLAAAPPDGYTLCLMSVSQFLDATLAQKFVFDAKKDFTPLSLLAAVPLILVANPSTNIKTLKDLVAYAKAHPNELNYSSGGAGGITHFAMESFLKKAGIKVTHVPYKGSGPAIADLLAGHVQLSFSTPAGINAYVKAGKLNAIGVSSEKPTELAPGVPTFTELGLPGIHISTWYGFFGPANMAPDLVARIAGSVIKASSPKDVRDKLFAAGNEPVLSSPAEFTKFLANERALWAAVAKDIGFKREG
ncbi:MAG: tripartite tricarboxylate transporter substrate binding protein [Pseudomonadota bacterium]